MTPHEPMTWGLYFSNPQVRKWKLGLVHRLTRWSSSLIKDRVAVLARGSPALWIQTPQLLRQADKQLDPAVVSLKGGGRGKGPLLSETLLHSPTLDQSHPSRRALAAIWQVAKERAAESLEPWEDLCFVSSTTLSYFRVAGYRGLTLLQPILPVPLSPLSGASLAWNTF